MGFLEDVWTVYKVQDELVDISLECDDEGITGENLGDHPEIIERFEELEQTYEEFSGLDSEEVSPEEYLKEFNQYEGLQRQVACALGSLAGLKRYPEIKDANEYFTGEFGGWPDLNNTE